MCMCSSSFMKNVVVMRSKYMTSYFSGCVVFYNISKSAVIFLPIRGNWRGESLSFCCNFIETGLAASRYVCAYGVRMQRGKGDRWVIKCCSLHRQSWANIEFLYFLGDCFFLSCVESGGEKGFVAKAVLHYSMGWKRVALWDWWKNNGIKKLRIFATALQFNSHTRHPLLLLLVVVVGACWTH